MVGSLSVCHVYLQLFDRPYFDYNLANHGRPNRFILTERSGVGGRGGWDGRGGGERRGGAHVLKTHPDHPSGGLKMFFISFTFEGTRAHICLLH